MISNNKIGLDMSITNYLCKILKQLKNDYKNLQSGWQFRGCDKYVKEASKLIKKYMRERRQGGIKTGGKKDRKKFSVSESEGRTALTLFEVLEEFEFTSYLKVNLKTGRTHQIRVHLSGIGTPVFGDPIYGGRQIMYGSNLPKIKLRVNNLLEIIQRQALHAKTIGFYHPHKKKRMFFDSELPDDMKLLLTKLRRSSSEN